MLREPFSEPIECGGAQSSVTRPDYKAVIELHADAVHLEVKLHRELNLAHGGRHDGDPAEGG